MKHKLISLRWKFMVMISIIFSTLNTVAFGVPLSMSYSNQENIKNEHFIKENAPDEKLLVYSNCIVNGSKYIEGEHVPRAGPCEECVCHPPNVVCSMMKCPINSGCITIQLPNKCCPNYKCDCEHNGVQYNNGEKINKTDESACRVCFCNGGEIVCTSIVCYTRNDCQGYYLPGDCCPKYDNCSLTSKGIEQKSKEPINLKKSNGNIHYWLHSTEQNYNEDSIWKRDTVKSQKHESPTAPNIVTVPSTVLDSEKVSKRLSTSLPLNNTFDKLDASRTTSTIENYTIFNEHNYEITTPESLITVNDFGMVENSKTSFLGYEIDNLTGNKEITESYLKINNETLETISKFEDLFDSTADIDNSVVITLINGTETIIDITEAPATEEISNVSTEMTSTQVEIFDPRDLRLDTEQEMMEFSTVTPELDVTTQTDYEDSREATTPRTPDKSTIGTPHKLVIDGSPKMIKDLFNTEIIFTDLENTTDIFGPNFNHQSYKTQSHKISSNSDAVESQIKELNNVTTFFPNSGNMNKSQKTTETPQIELTSKPYSGIKINENPTSVNIEFEVENITVKINNETEILNSTNFLELETNNITECINNSCTNHSKLNDELLDSQTETTLTTPFIIETKVLPNQDSPRLVIKKMPYPKEYPEEFETIQNGPSLTITKRTYTSIPDIVYTTTTMVTLPTLELIYKADKEIEKYLANMQSTTIKPSNNLSPLKNISTFNST